MWQVNIHKLCIGRQAIGPDKKLLKNAFTRSDFKIEKLFLKRLKKL